MSKNVHMFWRKQLVDKTVNELLLSKKAGKLPLILVNNFVNMDIWKFALVNIALALQFLICLEAAIRCKVGLQQDRCVAVVALTRQ